MGTRLALRPEQVPYRLALPLGHRAASGMGVADLVRAAVMMTAPVPRHRWSAAKTTTQKAEF